MTATPHQPVAVVIPAHNAAATIGVQLSALARQQYPAPWRVVVVDDMSTDDTPLVVERLIEDFPVPLTLIRLAKHGGSGTARNAGVAATTEPLVLFCDADDEVAPGWVAALATALNCDDGVGGRLDFEQLNPPSLIRWMRPSQYETGWDGDTTWGKRSPVGACCGVTHDAWHAIGGFNPYMARVQDGEFYWRLQVSGRSLRYVPDAVVHYRGATNARGVLRRQFLAAAELTMILRGYRHPHRRRQLLLETAGTLRKAPRVFRAETRIAGIRDLVWVAGRLAGLFLSPRRARCGPNERHISP